jgi:hypothetical protein
MCKFFPAAKCNQLDYLGISGHLLWIDNWTLWTAVEDYFLPIAPYYVWIGLRRLNFTAADDAGSNCERCFCKTLNFTGDKWYFVYGQDLTSGYGPLGSQADNGIYRGLLEMPNWGGGCPENTVGGRGYLTCTSGNCWMHAGGDGKWRQFESGKNKCLLRWLRRPMRVRKFAVKCV